MKFHLKTWSLLSGLTLSVALIGGCNSEESTPPTDKPAESTPATPATSPAETTPAPAPTDAAKPAEPTPAPADAKPAEPTPAPAPEEKK